VALGRVLVFNFILQATPIATTPSQHLPQSFFARPAEQVAPDLIGCLLVKRQLSGELLWGVIVETEAYSQDDPACHGYRRRSPSNETLFGEPGRFYVYVSYGIHHCVKRAVTARSSIWA
jgi:DNA-3-methyladenine glycosylase